MCGLVGLAGFLEPHKHKAVMKDLLYLNALRGKDSTGLSVVTRDRQVITRKMTVPGYDFIEYPVVDKAMTHGDQIWMGHGRYKTYGEITKANAHPFEVLDAETDEILLVGTHNGTLQNKFDIERKAGLGRFDTDSEALFNWLVVSANYKEAIGALEGAWSLVWWDPTTDTLRLCRNKERPLIYAFSEDRRVFGWASETWMLYNAFRRNGLKPETNDKGFSCYMTNEDTLYTLEIPQERDKELPALKKEGGYVGKKPTGHFHNGKWGWGDVQRIKREEEEAEKAKSGAANKEKNKNVIDLYPEGPRDKDRKVLRGFQGELLTWQEWDEIESKGCGWCKEPFRAGYVKAFLDHDTMVCEHCMRDKHPDADPLDDDPPFDLSYGEDEYKDLIAKAAKGAN